MFWKSTPQLCLCLNHLMQTDPNNFNLIQFLFCLTNTHRIIVNQLVAVQLLYQEKFNLTLNICQEMRIYGAVSNLCYNCIQAQNKATVFIKSIRVREKNLNLKKSHSFIFFLSRPPRPLGNDQRKYIHRWTIQLSINDNCFTSKAWHNQLQYE